MSRISIRPLVTALAVLMLALPAVAAAAPAPAPAGAKVARVAPLEASDAVININDASVEQLTYLPGIGEAKAERIVAFRAKHAFKTTAELARVRGIGLKTVRKLNTWLRVSGPTTLSGPVRLPKAEGGAGGKRWDDAGEL